MKISIITATYNSSDKLQRTIDSIRMQQYSELEYIIIDGGSTDSTLKIINANKDIISNIVSEPDQGISDAFNKGIKLASGEFIGIVSSDDYLLPEALSKVAKAASEYPDADVIYGNAVIVEPGDLNQFLVRPDPDLSTIWHRQPLKHAATFVRKNAYDKYGQFNLKYRYAMDYELILRFYINNAHFKYLDDSLAAFSPDGINSQNIFKTIAEVRDASISLGYSITKAYLLYFYKYLYLFIRNIFLKSKFIVSIYRKLSARFSSIS